MNVYDFDHTIYDGDCSLDFAIFLMRRHPGISFWIPLQILAVCGIKLKIISTKRGKELFFSFLKFYPVTTDEISLFWQKHKRKLSLWYLQQQKDDDLIISASPYFLLAPLLTGEMNKYLLATQMAPQSGKINGENCKGEEKVSALQRHFSTLEIENFYSDSRSDTPLAKFADNAFIVKHRHHHTTITPWFSMKDAQDRSHTSGVRHRRGERS